MLHIIVKNTALSADAYLRGMLKVSYSRNVFLGRRCPPKYERKQVDLRYHSSKVEFVCSFFGGNRWLQKFISKLTDLYVNGISCSLIGTTWVSRIFFRCIIFNYYNISICKKEKLKDATSKKFVKPMEVNGTCIGFTNIL